METPYPFHAAELSAEHKLELTSHDRLLYVGEDHPGTVATVLENENAAESAQNPNFDQSASQDSYVLKVSLQPHSTEVLASLREAQKLLRSGSEQYYPSGAVAARLKVTPQGLSRITGSLWVSTGISHFSHFFDTQYSHTF